MESALHAMQHFLQLALARVFKVLFALLGPRHQNVPTCRNGWLQLVEASLTHGLAQSDCVRRRTAAVLTD